MGWADFGAGSLECALGVLFEGDERWGDALEITYNKIKNFLLFLNHLFTFCSRVQESL